MGRSLQMLMTGLSLLILSACDGKLTGAFDAESARETYERDWNIHSDDSCAHVWRTLWGGVVANGDRSMERYAHFVILNGATRIIDEQNMDEPIKREALTLYYWLLSPYAELSEEERAQVLSDAPYERLWLNAAFGEEIPEACDYTKTDLGECYSQLRGDGHTYSVPEYKRAVNALLPTRVPLECNRLGSVRLRDRLILQ